jgi:spore maturation protein CgeB
MRTLVSYPVKGLKKAKREVEAGIVNDIRSAAADLNFDVRFLNHIDYCRYFYTAQELDEAYRRKESGLMKLYSYVESIIGEFDAFIVLDVNVFHPDFLEKLSVYKAYYSFDDPDASFLRVMPYAYAFDHVFTVTPIYNSERTMPDQFKKWGVRFATFLPLGAISSQFRTIDESFVFSQKRPVELVFVGTATTAERNAKLFQVKKHFKNRFAIYGHWHWKANLKNIIINRNYSWISPHFDLTSLYLKSQIGINIHDSNEYGFGNRRTYELPLNGVMLVSDFKEKALGDIYELNKEAVGFEDINEAIDLIEYYLKHDDERREIAVNGFKKAKEKYLFSNIFRNALLEINTNIRALSKQ